MKRLRRVLIGLALIGASCCEKADAPKTPQERFVDLRGKLLTEEGKPASRTAIMLDLGRQKFDFGGGFDFLAAGHRWVRTSEDGSFVFEKVPAMARIHVVSLGLSEDHGPTGWVERACMIRGGAEDLSRATLDLRLGSPKSTVRGTIVAPQPSTRIYAKSGDGWILSSADPKKENGQFALTGMLPGESLLILQRGNFVLESRSLTLPEGRDLDLGRIELPPSPLQRAAHPEVNAVRVRLVDSAGMPLPGYRLTFSTFSADGQSGADEKGEILMKDGGISIGGPPFRVYLDLIESAAGDRRFIGSAKEQGDTVIVTVSPMTKVRLFFRKSAFPVTELVVFAKTQDPANVFVLDPKDGAFESWLPRGRVRLIIGTVRGTTTEMDLEVPATGEHSATLDLP